MSIRTVQSAIIDQFRNDVDIGPLFSSDITGTVDSDGTAMTGTGTAFTTEIQVGDYIGSATVGYRKVMSIASDTSLVVKTAFTPNLSDETINITHIRKGLPDNLNIAEVGKTIRVAFISAAGNDLEVIGSKVSVHYGFVVVVGFKEPDEDEAEDRKSEYDRLLNNNIDKGATFNGAVIGTTTLGQIKFANNPNTEGIYLGAAPLVVNRHETRGNR